MATTPIIVEMLIIGFFASVWMFLFAMRCSLFNLDDLLKLIPALKDWSAIVLFASTALFYQIGWLVNSFCHGFAIIFLEKRVRDPIFKREELLYEPVRATVYQKASTELRADLGLDRSVVRLSRAGVLNFLLIGVAALSFGSSTVFVSLFSFAFSLICVWQWRQRYKRYHRRMIEAYKVVTS